MRRILSNSKSKEQSSKMDSPMANTNSKAQSSKFKVGFACGDEFVKY